MTLAPVDDITPTEPPEPPEPILDRFSVVAGAGVPTQGTENVRSNNIEVAWLPYIGPAAMLFARRCDQLFSGFKDGQQSIAVIVHRWADDLGLQYPEELIAAKNRLLRFGLATWEDKGHVFALKRNWPYPVPDAIATPEHRMALLSIRDSVNR